MICIADDPNQPGFSVACYFKELDAFMQRGRELRKQGMNDQQIFEEKKRSKSRHPANAKAACSDVCLFSRRKDVDATTGEVKTVICAP